ncbi:ribonuclease E activity regulator RraA [Sphingomonas sp. DT-204]|uniref:ribonuclease E activity regulator RraA n=1 Tax=Sphingomonas sp. DT-204 TaxID=3396166 RepID=UPI003F19ED56
MDAALPETTADICDLLDDRAQVVALDWRMFGTRMTFRGPAATCRSSDDTSVIRPILEKEGQGRVLVIDNGGKGTRAVFGGNFARLAHDNGWAGVIINGTIRDAAEINALPVGVRALSTSPRRPFKQQNGVVDVPVVIAGIQIMPGDWIAADEDGVVAVRRESRL